MADNNQDFSRRSKNHKKRGTRRLLSWVLGLFSLILIAVLLIAVFNNAGDEPASQDSASEDTENQQTIADQIRGTLGQDEESEEESADDQSDANSEEDEREDKDSEKEEVEASDDNVSEAYTENWDPVGTEQTGEHTTTFEKNTQDWSELMTAVSQAAGLSQDNMTTWWVENNGNGGNNVIATVSDSAETQTYRVYASWVDGKGWQAEKVEVLKVNDKKNQ